MAVTLTSTGVQFPDGTTQTTAATGGGDPLTTIAAASVGAVGTYAFLWSTSGTSINAGGTLAGSSLRYAGMYNSQYNGTTTLQSNGINMSGNGGTPAGTWRCMGKSYAVVNTYGGIQSSMTLWLRIS